MNLDIIYHNEDIRTFDWECDELMASTKTLLDLNTKLKEEETRMKIKDLQEKIKEIDEKYKRV